MVAAQDMSDLDRQVIIDGWYLNQWSVGMGVYTKRLINGLISQSETLSLRIRVAMPKWALDHVEDNSIREHAVLLPASTARIPLLGQALWQNMVGAHCRRRFPTAVLVSPAPFWALRAPSRMIVVYHDCIHRTFPRYQGKRFVRRWFLRRRERFLRRCSAVLTESQYSKNEIIGLLEIDPSIVHVIHAWLPPEYNPRSAANAADGVRKKYRLPERFWLYLGGYDYRKNVEFLMQAYAAASAQKDCPPLVLAGNIPTDTRKPTCNVFSTLKQTHLDERQILMPGPIHPEDIPGLYGAADLVIYPSLYEGYGLPPLEAMGCGCPALVADNSSMPEVVADRSYRFATNTPDELLGLLRRAADRPLPLNPSFDREAFSEASAMVRYGNLLRSVDDDAARKSYSPARQGMITTSTTSC